MLCVTKNKIWNAILAHNAVNSYFEVSSSFKNFYKTRFMDECHICIFAWNMK